MNMPSTEEGWEDAAVKLLYGRKIKGVRYMNTEEMQSHGWYSRPFLIELDNGTILYSSRDDEGNDGGALFTTNRKTPVIPVIR